jgi:hypothetical protein
MDAESKVEVKAISAASETTGQRPGVFCGADFIAPSD